MTTVLSILGGPVLLYVPLSLLYIGALRQEIRAAEQRATNWKEFVAGKEEYIHFLSERLRKAQGRNLVLTAHLNLCPTAKRIHSDAIQREAERILLERQQEVKP